MKLKSILVKRLPDILAGLAVTGIFTSVCMAVTATPKALKLIEKEKEELGVSELTAKETVKATWKCYIPTALSVAATVTCVVLGNRESNKRNAALAAAYSLSESALKTYQAKVIETIGEKKEEAVRDAIAKDVVKRAQANNANPEIEITGYGNTIVIDAMTGRQFTHDIEKIRKAEANLNKDLYSSMFVSVADLYYELGLRIGDLYERVGWNADSGPVNIQFSSQLLDDDRPCLVLSYQVGPRFDYRCLH